MITDFKFRTREFLSYELSDALVPEVDSIESNQGSQCAHESATVIPMIDVWIEKFGLFPVMLTVYGTQFGGVTTQTALDGLAGSHIGQSGILGAP